MVISIPFQIQRVFAFLSNIWSFILTLARSLLALFVSRHRSGDPLALPRVNRTRKDALARAHRHLRPILLTPRTLTLSSPSADAQLGRGTRTPSALTLFHGINDDTSALPSGIVPQGTTPERTSPKLDPNDAELGVSAVLSSTSGGLNSHDHSGPGPAGTGTGVLASRGGDGTPDTSSPVDNYTTSFSPLPLTPPDPCYLGPVPSTTDLPYAEPWPTNSAFDRNKQRLPGSPLKTSFGNEAVFPHVMVQARNPDSPSLVFPYERWAPVPIWTSTPRKREKENIPLALFVENSSRLENDHASLVGIPKTMASRTLPATGAPYDDTSLRTNSSINSTDHVRRHRQVPIPRPVTTVGHAGMYAWRRHGARLPGKPGGNARTQSQSQSHVELRVNRPIVEWYHADAYMTSPATALSPPVDKYEDEDEDEDEDEVPLGRLVQLRMRQRVGVGVSKAAAHRGKRAASEESLFFAIDTPTKVGVPKLRVEKGVASNDPFEILPLKFTHATTATIPAPATDVFIVDASTTGRGVSDGVVKVV